MRRSGMARRGIHILLVVLTLLLTFQSAFSADYYALSVRALVTVTKPNVNLQAGTFGNSTLYVNSTSAMVTTPTLNYPTGYNIITGTYTSGSTPGSVNAVDTNYFITASTISTGPRADFKDGASVAVPNPSPGLLDSISTTFPSRDNLVLAFVQFDNTGVIKSLLSGDLEIRRGTQTTDPLISENQLGTRIGGDGGAGDGLFAVLIGKDASAPANPTYGLFGGVSGPGVNAEVKFLIINGLASGNSVFGDGASTALQTTATTLISQTTTLPAASASLPNIVVAVVQIDSNNIAGLVVPAGSTRLLRGVTVLATNEYEQRLANNGVGDGGFQVLVAIDTSAAANPTYNVDTLNSVGAHGSGEAKILIFRGVSASSVDTASVALGTTRTIIGSLATTFASGDDVIIGAIQLDAVGATRTIAAAADDIRKTGDSSSSSNQFAHTVAVTSSDGGGQYQSLVGKVATAAANPSYEGAATAPAASSLNAELKLIAIHVADASITAETEFTFGVSSATPVQLNFTLVQQYNLASLTVTIQVYNYTGASYPTTGQGYLSYTSSATPNTDETRSLNITTNPQHHTSGGAAKVKVKGVTTSTFDQKANLVRLYYYQQTYDHVLKIVNQQATVYNIRLNAQGLTQSNIGRLTNFTAWFHDGSSSVQLQILSGSFSTQTGTLYSLGASATAYIAVRVTASSSGLSTIDCVLQTYHLGGNSHTDYRLTFQIT